MKGIILAGASNLERFEIGELNERGRALSAEEKQRHPKSSCSITGIYFYPKGVREMVHVVKPAPRGEPEITTLNEMYPRRGMLDVQGKVRY